MTNQRAEVLVGIDGSIASNAALMWAAGEARVRNAELVMVHIADSRTYGLWTAGRHRRDGVRELAAPIVEGALALVNRAAPDVEVRAKVMLGPPVHTLLRLGRQMDLTVLGPRGRGSTPNTFWLGSVTQQVLAHTVSPVVSVSGRTTTERRVATDRIVVAVHDIGPRSAASMHFAFFEADRRDASVLLVHAMGVSEPGEGATASIAEKIDATSAKVAEWSMPWKDDYPDVDVEVLISVGRPADGLVEATSASDLLVLGRHLASTNQLHHLGAVTLGVLHDAACPVAVVPDPA